MIFHWFVFTRILSGVPTSPHPKKRSLLQLTWFRDFRSCGQVFVWFFFVNQHGVLERRSVRRRMPLIHVWRLVTPDDGSAFWSSTKLLWVWFLPISNSSLNLFGHWHETRYHYRFLNLTLWACIVRFRTIASMRRFWCDIPLNFYRQATKNGARMPKTSKKKLKAVLWGSSSQSF